MARIVAQLVDVRRNPICDAVVLLQIDRERDAAGLLANLPERGNFLLAVERYPHDAGASRRELMRLRHGGVDIDSARRTHRLHHDRRVAANLEAANPNTPGITPATSL